MLQLASATVNSIKINPYLILVSWCTIFRFAHKCSEMHAIRPAGRKIHRQKSNSPVKMYL